MTVVETSFSNEQRRQPRVQINHVSKYHREGGITYLKAKEWLVVLLRDVHLEANSNLKYIWNVFQLYERSWWPQNGWVLSLNSFEFRTFNSTKKHENFAKLRQWFFFLSLWTALRDRKYFVITQYKKLSWKLFCIISRRIRSLFGVKKPGVSST